MTYPLSKQERAKMDVFINFACGLATLSKCTERFVAAIIVDADWQQVYSIGINGGPVGGDNCLCAMSAGKYSCIHAEANALAKCKADTKGATMICTLSPCVTCASLAINSGIKTFIYIDEWKDTTGIKLMQQAGIDVLQVTKGGVTCRLQ